MGVRIAVYLTHDLTPFDDVNLTLSRLEETLPTAMAVREYWLTDHAWSDGPQSWGEAFEPRIRNFPSFEGPGALWLRITPVAACISTTARWGSFLSIERLHRVHLEAFRAIAKALHSPQLVICADDLDDIRDIFLDEGTQGECKARLSSSLGPPHQSMEIILPAVLKRNHQPIWYLETL